MSIHDDTASLIGIPFKRFGRGPDGLDCIGLILMAFEKRGIKLIDPIVDRPASDSQWRMVKNLPEPWDIVVLGEEPTQHAGLYLSAGRILVADEELGKVVTLGPMEVGKISEYLRFADDNSGVKKGTARTADEKV